MNNREIDVTIAEQVMGLGADVEAPSYSSDVASAWSVVDKLSELFPHCSVWINQVMNSRLEVGSLSLAPRLAPREPRDRRTVPRAGKG